MNDSEFTELVWRYLDGALDNTELIAFHRELAAEAGRLRIFHAARTRAGLDIGHERHASRAHRRAA
jgi:hypothetical protein